VVSNNRAQNAKRLKKGELSRSAISLHHFTLFSHLPPVTSDAKFWGASFLICFMLGRRPQMLGILGELAGDAAVWSVSGDADVHSRFAT
jgi:hypothetical protein